jgi:hypothetical protein
MTDDRQLSLVLEHWLAEGPSQMPDRVYDTVADRIARQPQRPAWRLDWRHLRMNTTFKLATAVATMAIVAVVGYNLLPRGSTGMGGPAPTPSPTASPTTTPTASPISTPPWDAARPGSCGQLDCAGPLRAGTYTSKALNPAVTYTLTADWVNLRDWPEFFQLYPDTPANRALAAAGQYPPHIVILPGPIRVSPSAACAGDSTEVDAARFVEFLTTRQNLATTGPVPVTVGGLTGQQIDASVEPGWTGCLPHALLDESLTPQDRIRYIVLGTPDGGSLMIRLRALTDSDAFFAEAMQIVEGFEFDVAP